MTISFTFFILIGFCILTLQFSLYKYKELLNPIACYTVFTLIMQTLFSGVISLWLPSQGNVALKFDEVHAIWTVYMAILNGAGFTCAYLVKTTKLTLLYSYLLIFFRLSNNRFANNFNLVKITVLIILFLFSFFLLAIAGGGGSLWLTNPRLAYLLNRAGAGPFFAATQWLLMFTLLYLLWSIRPKKISYLFLILFSVTIPMNFLGSKSNIASIFVAGLAYYNFTVKKIKTIYFIFIPIFFMLLMIILITIQGSSDLENSYQYFRDYFSTTATFFANFDSFGFYYGKATISKLWFFLPRGLFPEKPYEYGTTLIHKVLFPGAAEQGHTPGILPWTIDYLDFGVIGVLFSGFLSGLLVRIPYDFYLKNRFDFFAFFFMMQLSIYQLLIFAPLPIFLILTISQSIFFRLTTRFQAQSH